MSGNKKITELDELAPFQRAMLKLLADIAGKDIIYIKKLLTEEVLTNEKEKV